MKKTKVNAAVAGLKLAKPVENEAGMVLYGAGMEITEQMVSKLKMMSIEAIYVEGMEDLRFSKDEYLKVVDTAFLKVGGSSIMDGLKQAMREHIDSLYNNK